MKQEPIDILLSPLRRILAHPATSGLLLLFMVIVAMIWANSPWEAVYHHLWEVHFTIGFPGFALDKSLHHWINDGLMSIFFFVVGLEIKREIINGELSSWKQASLPIAAAVGGMIIPALLYLIFNYGGEGASGWGIPMATDIAFTLGLLSLVGSRVPLSLKIFITALATVDDIGAVLVIAIFYTPDVNFVHLTIAGVCLLVMLSGSLLGIRSVWFYLFFGIVGLWTGMLLSGVHATLAGVLAALTIPARVKVEDQEYHHLLKSWSRHFAQAPSIGGPLISSDQLHITLEVVKGSVRATPPLQRLEHVMAPLVTFGVMPLFALANAGVSVKGDILTMLAHPVSLGIIVGLVVGKIGGIWLFSRIMATAGWGRLPKRSNWSQMGGVGMMAGIGFTMSLFIAELAFTDPVLVQHAKIGILTASFLAAVTGMLWLYFLPTRAISIRHSSRPIAKKYAQ
ncbi:MAG: Na+/H+ antiporter NhaA [Bacteroidota bacterium]